MTDYLKCRQQAELIAEEFHKHIGIPGKQRKFFVEYPDVQKFAIKDPILILGLNPSGGDENAKNERKYPNLLSYIPQIHETLKDFSGDENKQAELLTYKPYFKTYIESFQNLLVPYNPVWYNRAVLESLLNENKDVDFLNDGIKSFLHHFCQYDNGNYIIFADLVQYQRTNSKEIIPYLEDEKTFTLVNEYIKLLLEFIKPKLVLSANAFVSHYLIKHLNKGVDCTSITKYDTEIFLASMLTGQRAMDTFSRMRLFKEMQDFITKNS